MEHPVMPLIEGVGDEVTIVIGLVLLVLALILAWLSTYVADRSDQLLGAIVTTGNSPLVRFDGVERYVSNSGSSDAAEAQVATDSSEEKPEEDGESESESVVPGNTLGNDPLEGGNTSDSNLDHLLNIQGLRKRTTSSSENSAEGRPNIDWLEESNVTSRSTESNELRIQQIKVRLKFLNETEEIALVKPEDTIGFLKSKYFPGQEQQMKLIYQGQILQDQTRTLGSLNITDNCVIHCHFSQTTTSASTDVSSAVESNGVAINIGNLMIPLFVGMLAVVWYFRFTYRQFFTAPATVSLVGVTVFFSFLVFGMYGR
ncbi:transmembrane and ubiquitin-like domain-containing protein 2 isoform X2 [Latimeria chalumnae]|uniref:Transmembrane and ubiquitin like domain containing 2 n=1 Tax=Latimeria chalumnae TaxID=7897 RepID=M3XJ72_LATCH|nr:PREDICTED: transmembrane and ubiquitin-like domain-containing protein 2 isoform X2 [Latimeria chalumnae]|eukprot:XP_014341723.1 PREDICTED: transmembrane and ubiquitin-like domain-containing protein 2 isoform X2 [Latimeria chalumnae]